MKPPGLTKERRAWLASLKDGDEVAVVGGGSPTIRQVVIRNNWPALRYGSRAISLTKGGRLDLDSCCEWVVPATDEHRRSVLIGQTRIRLSSLSWATWGGVTDEQIAAIATILGWDQ